jgi:hypothetical protein
MPRENGFWFDDYQDVIPFRPESAEQNPKHPIPHSWPRARVRSLENAQLLAECKDLKAEVVSGAESAATNSKESKEKLYHGREFIS